MPGFATPLSGLNAASMALSAIANNLANLNTVAYKQMRPVFRDLFYQTMGSSGAGDPIQVGVGAAIQNVSSIFSRGNVEPTGVPSDVAIMGDGFFVVQQDGAQGYTRAGNFQVSEEGLLTTSDNQLVLGYPAVNGVVQDGGTLAEISVGKSQLSPPHATSAMRLHLNLDARADVGQSFNTPASVFDSLGASHTLNVTFTKTGENTWDYAITVPAADVGATGSAMTVKTGTLVFDGDGKLTSPAANVSGINVSNLSDGATDLGFSWELFSGTSPLITQVASESSTAATEQDGFKSGTLLSFEIQADGVVMGTFSNGQTQALARLALASFANEQGLERMGDNTFSATLSSGPPNIGAPGTTGRGSVAGSSLEQSNVDIAKEFAQLIVAQRGFQANARAITTLDEVTQDAINLKR